MPGTKLRAAEANQLDFWPPPPPFQSYSTWFIRASDGREVCLHVTHERADGSRGGFHRWCGHKRGPGKCIDAFGKVVETCPRHALGYRLSCPAISSNTANPTGGKDANQDG